MARQARTFPPVAAINSGPRPSPLSKLAAACAPVPGGIVRVQRHFSARLRKEVLIGMNSLQNNSQIQIQRPGPKPAGRWSKPGFSPGLTGFGRVCPALTGYNFEQQQRCHQRAWRILTLPPECGRPGRSKRRLPNAVWKFQHPGRFHIAAPGDGRSPTIAGPAAFQRAGRLAKRVRLVYSFRRLTLRSATGTAQRARPYRCWADPGCARGISLFPSSIAAARRPPYGRTQTGTDSFLNS